MTGAEPAADSGDDRDDPRTRDGLWRRLRSVLSTVERSGLAGLSDGQVDDLGKLYRAAATYLAYQRAFGASARRTEELNALVARAHAVVYGRAPRASRVGWLWWSFLAFPRTVRSSLRYHALAGALLALGIVYGYLGAAADPEWALAFVPSGDDRTPYATRDELIATLLVGREGDVDAGEKSFFAAVLWQHNTKIALLSFFVGFLAGIPSALLLLHNGIMLGSYSFAFHSRDLAYEWWAWILPHGVTELLGLVLLAGGGLWIGHIVVAPGERSRADRFREVRGDLIRLLLFAFPMLLLAAVIEAFVRQSGLGDAGRYAFAGSSALVWALYLAVVRPPRAMLARQRAPATVAEQAIPLPELEEMLGGSG